MPKFFRTQTIHKLFMLTGIGTTVVTLSLAWTLMQRIEPQAIDILRQQILAELDVQSFHQQLQAMEAEEQAVGGEYSPQQLEILQADTQVMQREIRAAAGKLERINQKRAELARNIKLTLLITLIVLSASVILIIFGYIGWYFRIRILQESDHPREFI